MVIHPFFPVIFCNTSLKKPYKETCSIHLTQIDGKDKLLKTTRVKLHCSCFAECRLDCIYKMLKKNEVEWLGYQAVPRN